MKKLLIVILIILFPAVSFAAGDVYQTWSKYGEFVQEILFQCIGDSGDGSIPDTDIKSEFMQHLTGWKLYQVIADPGAVAPDAADVSIKDPGSLDFLDGNGTNLIHATATQTTHPAMDGLPASIPVVGTLTLDVDNQATISATYTIQLIFVKGE